MIPDTWTCYYRDPEDDATSLTQHFTKIEGDSARRVYRGNEGLDDFITPHLIIIGRTLPKSSGSSAGTRRFYYSHHHTYEITNLRGETVRVPLVSKYLISAPVGIDDVAISHHLRQDAGLFAGITLATATGICSSLIQTTSRCAI